MTFRESVLSLYEITKTLQGEAEVVTEVDVVSAFVVLNYIDYENVADVFLGCSSLNLLNRYIKQPDSKINYTFRKHMHNFIKGIEDVGVKTKLKVFFDEEDNLITFAFWIFQFSFHGVRFNDVVKNLQRGEIEWDGIRKQMCAKTIFDFALQNEFISDKTLDGRSLKELVKNEIKLYETGGYRFIKGKLIRVKDNHKEIKQEDKYDKNYIRKKLYECQDRPVILIGTFAKVWDKHVTFTTIRPYLRGNNTLTICNHINLFRPDVEMVFNINDLIHGKKYYIIGRCKPYPNSDRMGVNLDVSIKPSPIIKVASKDNMPLDIFSKCHRFDLEEFRSNKSRHLLL